MSTWIRVSDGLVNAAHIVRIVEDVRDGKDVSILHMVDRTTAVSEVYSCNLPQKVGIASKARFHPSLQFILALLHQTMTHKISQTLPHLCISKMTISKRRFRNCNAS